MTVKEQFIKSVIDLFGTTCIDSVIDMNRMSVTESNENVIPTTASELVSSLWAKAHAPIAEIPKEECTCVVYDNITAVIMHDLSAMRIEFVDDLTVTIDGVGKCDKQQLANFVIQLDRVLPKWQWIWAKRNRLIRQRSAINAKLSSRMREIRDNRLTIRHRPEPIEVHRMLYYNVRAEQFLLQHEIPDWQNKNSEEELIAACMAFNLVPPVEQWATDFDAFIDDVELQRKEKLEMQKEQERLQKKSEHIRQLKRLKLEAQLYSIERHSGFDVNIVALDNIAHPSFFSRPFPGISLRLNILGISHRITIRYDIFDSVSQYILSHIDAINDQVALIDHNPTAENEIEKLVSEMEEKMIETNKMGLYV